MHVAHRARQADSASGEVAAAQVRSFITLDRTSVFVAVVAVAGLHLTIARLDAVWLIYPALLTHAALLTVARGLVDRSLTAALAVTAGSNWLLAVAITVMLPWLLAVLVLTVIMPLVLAVPNLGRRELTWFLASAALTLAVIGAIGIGLDDDGIIDDVSDDLELIVVMAGLAGQAIPIGLLVQTTNETYRRSAEEAIRLQSEIAESRRRLVHAADTERSRIERNLHDGAQQRLVALGLSLRRLAGRRRRGVTIDLEDLDVAVEEVEAAMTELRDLARGIHPPLLELRGLPEALNAVARPRAEAVTLRIGAIGRFEGDVESAVYFCCTEAMQNASKHAGSAAVTIELDHDDDTGLRLTVSDDGPGFDPETVAGTRGLINMADRVGSVGGLFELASEPGDGTVVTAVFPDAHPRTDREE